MNNRIEIPADKIEHAFGAGLVEAARALFSHVAPSFSPERREQVRAARDAGAALVISVQIKPTAVISCLVEYADGQTENLFDLVVEAKTAQQAMDTRPTVQ